MVWDAHGADSPEAVVHPGVPPPLWQPWCPFRVLQEPRVRPYLTLYARTQRYPGLLGTLDEVTERECEALDVMTWARQLPRMESA